MDTHKEKFKIRLGLFAVGGMVLFVLAIFVIGRQKNLFDPVFKISTTFYNVSGLQVGNNVRFAGINVGTVNKIIILNDSMVMVELMVKMDVQRFIKKDADVAIGSEGIIGDRLVIISQGSAESPVVKEGDYLSSTEPIETDAIMASLEVTALNAELMSYDLAEIVSNINSGKGILGRLISDSTMAKDLSRTMDNLESSSQGLEENMEAVKGSILFRNYFKKKKKSQSE
jgi:phospholipid/cholesterol/gamma-HCH transport system substrate-binding protein